MAKKRNRITPEMSKTIASSSPLIKKAVNKIESLDNDIINIDLNKLKSNPYQPRINYNIQTLNQLILSIEQNGLMQPIVITEQTDDNYHTIIAGHRRFEAYKIMGKKEIPAITIRDIRKKDLALLSLTENLMRENLHPIEIAIAMKNILDSNIVKSQNKLAEYLGLSKGYISKLMNILKLPDTIIKVIKNENYRDINILVLLNKLPSEEQMINTFNKIKDLSRAEAEKYIKNLQNEVDNNIIIGLKSTKTKINIEIKTNKLTEKQKSIILKKIDEIKECINSNF